MYFTVLTVHSLLRWAVIGLGVVAVASALRGGAEARKRALPFVIGLDLQVIAGALLWLFLSPLTSSLKDAMAAPEPRYFATAHPVMGLVAVGLAHAGNVTWKKGKQKVATGLLVGALLLSLAAVPWFRPLLRS